MWKYTQNHLPKMIKPWNLETIQIPNKPIPIQFILFQNEIYKIPDFKYLKSLYFCVINLILWNTKPLLNLDSFDRCLIKKWCFVWQIWSTPRDIYLVQNLVLWKKIIISMSYQPRMEYPWILGFTQLWKNFTIFISYNLFFYFNMFSSNNLNDLLNVKFKSSNIISHSIFLTLRSVKHIFTP